MSFHLIGTEMSVLLLLWSFVVDAVQDIPPPRPTPTARVAGASGLDIAPTGGYEAVIAVILAAVVIGVVLVVLRARRQ